MHRTLATPSLHLYACRLIISVVLWHSLQGNGTGNARTLIARFMGPSWGPSGADRTQAAPCWPHELCYLGILDMSLKITILVPQAHFPVTDELNFWYLSGYNVMTKIVCIWILSSDTNTTLWYSIFQKNVRTSIGTAAVPQAGPPISVICLATSLPCTVNVRLPVEFVVSK